MRSFPSRTDSPTFGSLHRRQHPSNWGSASDNLGSQESSPTTESRGANMRHPFFQRSDSIPVRVSHESRHGSRSSTPESTGSGQSHGSSSHSRPHSNGADSTTDGAYEEGSIPEGAEEHPGVASRTGRPSFTARRQPKVHHIPIHVEPRDGSHPVVLTPPAETASPRAAPNLSKPESPSTQHRPSTKQAFAMPEPNAANAARASPDLHNNNADACNNSKLAKEPGNATVTENEGRERTVPIAVPQTTSETEVTVTLPVPDKKKKSTVELVEYVRADVENLRKCVDQFSGTRGDKQYLYLDEMLTRDLIKLDNISTEGDEELRKVRRAVIIAINGCIQALEQKVLATDGDAGSCKVEEDVTGNDATVKQDAVKDQQPPETPEAATDAPVESAKDEKMDISEDVAKETTPPQNSSPTDTVVQEENVEMTTEQNNESQSENASNVELQQITLDAMAAVMEMDGSTIPVETAV